MRVAGWHSTTTGPSLRPHSTNASVRPSASGTAPSRTATGTASSLPRGRSGVGDFLDLGLPYPPTRRNVGDGRNWAATDRSDRDDPVRRVRPRPGRAGMDLLRALLELVRPNVRDDPA